MRQALGNDSDSIANFGCLLLLLMFSQIDFFFFFFVADGLCVYSVVSTSSLICVCPLEITLRATETRLDLR